MVLHAKRAGPILPDVRGRPGRLCHERGPWDDPCPRRGDRSPGMVLRAFSLPLHARFDVQGEGWSIRYQPVATTNNTAFGILREASVTLGFSLTYVPYEIPKGVFVTGINGSMNGDGGRYWQYWVDGTYGTVAADHKGLGDGDVVQWTFSTPSEGG